jgi:tRNA pseudouridine38-40 synthase
MRKAASYLPGTHDFAAFGTPPRSGGRTIRTVYQAHWNLDDPYLEFVITADAFLYHMVRRLVSLSVEIGQGRYPPEAVLQFLGQKAPDALQGLAPPQGLTLVEIVYGPERRRGSRKSEAEKLDLVEKRNEP